MPALELTRIAAAVADVPSGRFATLIAEADSSIGLFGHFDSYEEAWKATGHSSSNRAWLVVSVGDTNVVVYRSPTGLGVLCAAPAEEARLRRALETIEQFAKRIGDLSPGMPTVQEAARNALNGVDISVKPTAGPASTTTRRRR